MSLPEKRISIEPADTRRELERKAHELMEAFERHYGHVPHTEIEMDEFDDSYEIRIVMTKGVPTAH